MTITFHWSYRRTYSHFFKLLPDNSSRWLHGLPECWRLFIFIFRLGAQASIGWFSASFAALCLGNGSRSQLITNSKPTRAVLLSSRPGLGLENPQGHHLKVLALASDGQVLALALDRVQGQDLAKTWESPEHFQIIDADFMWCYRTMCIQRQMSARLLIIFTSPLTACHSQHVRNCKPW